MDKNIVLIVSGGRTGTGFFGDRLGGVIEDSFSVHEPDLLKLNLKDLNEKRKYFSLKYLIFDRIMKQNGIRQLSEKSLSGEIDNKTLSNEIKIHRIPYYNSINKSLIIESYYGWYGLIDQANSVFPNLKIIGIIRDPRDWVRSNINWETQYGSRDLSTKLGFSKLNPILTKDEEYIDKWGHMDTFDKLCWMWKTIYTEIYKLKNYENSRIYKFEQVFKSGKDGNFENLLDFIVTWNDKTFQTDVPDDFLNRKSNVNISYTFPKWKDWDKKYAISLQKICGDLAGEFGYCNEKEWLKKLN